MRTYRKLKARHLYLIGYAVLVIFVTLGFMRSEILGARLAYESIERARENCATQNAQAEGMVRYTETLVRAAQSDRDDLTEADRARADAFLEEVRESFTVRPCPVLPVPETWWERLVR